MKKTLISFAVAAAVALVATACGGDSAERQAAEWLNRAQTEADRGHYAEAMAAIDSLRDKCPRAVEARRRALKLYQEVNLKAAEQAVQRADEALRTVDAEYKRMKADVENLKTQGKATAAQLTALTRLRMKRDSLQTVFDVECAKIKYIHAKMKE